MKKLYETNATGEVAPPVDWKNPESVKARKRWLARQARSNRLVSGHCTKCGKLKEAEAETEYCLVCKELKNKQRSDKLKLRYRHWLNDGLCGRCGKVPFKEGCTQCQECLDYSAAHIHDSRNQLNFIAMQEKKCRRCSAPLEGSEALHCDICAAAISDRTHKNRYLNKNRIVAYFDNKCSRCGVADLPSAVYDAHHIDPATKSFSISSYLWKDFETVLKPELEKCILLCSNCHRTHHFYHPKAQEQAWLQPH